MPGKEVPNAVRSDPSSVTGMYVTGTILELELRGVTKTSIERCRWCGATYGASPAVKQNVVRGITYSSVHVRFVNRPYRLVFARLRAGRCGGAGPGAAACLSSSGCLARAFGK